MPRRRKPEPIYYIKKWDALYRRSDGNPKILPNEVLHRSGWQPVIGALTVSVAAWSHG